MFPTLRYLGQHEGTFEHWVWETKDDKFWTSNNDSVDLQGDCGLHLPNKDNYKGM